jgi:hypothetical protein
VNKQLRSCYKSKEVVKKEKISRHTHLLRTQNRKVSTTRSSPSDPDAQAGHWHETSNKQLILDVQVVRTTKDPCNGSGQPTIPPYELHERIGAFSGAKNGKSESSALLL